MAEKNPQEVLFDEHRKNCKMCFLVDKGWRVGLSAARNPAIRRCPEGRALLKPLQEKWRAERRTETKAQREARWKARHENSLQTFQTSE